MTGDIAELDDDGFLLIVDRKKDLIVTAGGKNVAPQPIENQLKQSPLVDAAVLVGDGRPYIVALVSPNTDELQRWATEKGLVASCLEELVELPEVHHEIDAAITAANSGLARYEQIKKFTVLPVGLSIEGGHLTPTLKVKRRVVEEQFADRIERLFAGSGT
jgi:long-chain acyl-CoA synthetase